MSTSSAAYLSNDWIIILESPETGSLPLIPFSIQIIALYIIWWQTLFSGCNLQTCTRLISSLDQSYPSSNAFILRFMKSFVSTGEIVSGLNSGSVGKGTAREGKSFELTDFFRHPPAQSRLQHIGSHFHVDWVPSYLRPEKQYEKMFVVWVHLLIWFSSVSSSWNFTACWVVDRKH